MDAYYTSEKPLTLDLARLCLIVRASSAAERKAVESVLNEFFNKTESGWQHNRIDSEIQEYAETVNRNKANGNRGGRPKITQSVISGIPSGEPKPNPNHKPLTTNQLKPLRFAQFWDAYPKKKSKGDAEKAFNKISPDEQLLNAMLTAIEAQKKSADWQREAGQYIPYPASWLNAKGWEDQIEVTKPESRLALY